MTVPTNPEPGADTAAVALAAAGRKVAESMAKMGVAYQRIAEQLPSARPLVAASGDPLPTVSERRADLVRLVAAVICPGPDDSDTAHASVCYPRAERIVDALAARGFLHLGPVVPDDPQVWRDMLADAIAMAPSDLDELRDVIAEKLYDNANDGGLPWWITYTNDLIMPSVAAFAAAGAAELRADERAARDAELRQLREAACRCDGPDGHTKDCPVHGPADFVPDGGDLS